MLSVTKTGEVSGKEGTLNKIENHLNMSSFILYLITSKRTKINYTLHQGCNARKFNCGRVYTLRTY